jgi:carbohydrate kinase (thermoresistant glucokinase family)
VTWIYTINPTLNILDGQKLHRESELLVRDRWYALIVAGPSGSGKSIVAELLGRELSLPVIDADDYHSRAAVGRMKSGMALTDDYREHWAERIIGGMIAWRRRGESVVIACSCLRRRTRDRFRTYVNEARIVGGQVVIAWLDVPPEVLKTRLQHREEESTHFFPASLLPSQLHTAEPPDPQMEPGVIRIPVTTDTPDIVARRIWASVPMLHPFMVRH